MLGWAAVVATGTACIAVLALSRGEPISAIWMVVASACVFAVAYRFHSAWLMAKGYRILATRFRTPHGEIDLVARKRDLVAFIEVKARASLDDAAYAVTPRQQARIIAAAQGWLMAHPEHAEFELRFDAVLIAPRRLPRHLLAAFDAST